MGISFQRQGRRMSSCFFDSVSRRLNIMQVYIHGHAYLVSRCLNPNIDEFLKRMESIGNTQTTVNNHVEGIIKTCYKEISEMWHSKTDRDLLTALLTQLTSVNFVTTRLKGSSSKRDARSCRNYYPGMVQRYPGS